jgi:hypothetical protein
MRHVPGVQVTRLAIALGALLATAGAAAPAATAKRPGFTHPTKITNPYLPLSSSRVVEMRGTEAGKSVREVRTRLSRTRRFTVHGHAVRAVIVRDVAYIAGVKREVAYDYYAQGDDGAVYYLGEDVNYLDAKGRRVVSHEGAFHYGPDTKTLGVAMPASVAVGDRFTFESVPHVGSEHARVVRTDGALTVPLGSYTEVLELAVFVKPDNDHEKRFYAKGVGLIREEGPDGAVEITDVRS